MEEDLKACIMRAANRIELARRAEGLPLAADAQLDEASKELAIALKLAGEAPTEQPAPDSHWGANPVWKTM